MAIKQIEADLSADITVEQKISLNNAYDKFQTTLTSKSQVSSHQKVHWLVWKKKADTEKSIVLTRKTQLQTDKLNREMGGSEIPLSDIYDEILAMDNDGMMNH